MKKNVFVNIISSGKFLDKETGSLNISDTTIRYIILNCICIFGVGALAFFVVMNILNDSFFDMINNSIMAVIGILCFFAARSKIPQAVLLWLLMIFFGLFCSLIVWSGDAQGSGFLGIYIYPPLTVILLGMNGGVALSLLLLCVVSIEFIVPGVSRFAYHPDTFPLVIASYLLETMIVTVFERSRQNKEKLNKKLTGELQHINENLQEIVEERTNSLLKLRDCFGRYLPDNIIKKIMENPNGPSLGGEKRLITVLITDIRGFTLLAEKTDSETIVKLLNHYFTVMVEIIHAFNGTIIEFLGDSILAIFGAPLENENHADYAVACAIKMQAEMNNVNKWNEENDCPVIEMGVGVNSGDSIVGNIGSDKAMKYNVIGKHVNLASRIESYSTGGEILVSDFTLRHLTAKPVVARTIEASPKGFSGTILVSQITELGEPFNVSHHNRLPPLTKLVRPVLVFCYMINEKDVDRNAIKAAVYWISEKAAVIVPSLSAGDMFHVFDNVKLHCTNVYVTAKVNVIKDRRIVVRFTSGADDFAAKIKERGL